MSEMIERVARALADAVSVNYDHLNNRTTFGLYARAAIEAMKDPTQGMAFAVADANIVMPSEARRIWNIMIDAAQEESSLS